MAVTTQEFFTNVFMIIGILVVVVFGGAAAISAFRFCIDKLDRLTGKTKNIEDIEDPTELLRAISTRDKWSELNPKTLLLIFSRADNDVMKIQRFRFISEMLNCVEKNYIPISKDCKTPEEDLDLFSMTLCNIGSLNFKRLLSETDENKKNIYIGTTEIAFLSSVLCDKYMLPAYACLIHLYLLFGDRKQAINCYKEASKHYMELFNAEAGSLSPINESIKMQAPGIRREIETLLMESGDTEVPPC